MREIHKHLGKLPVPEFDSNDELHSDVSATGAAAATGAARELARLRQERGNHLSVRIARRELRAWLRSGKEGQRVEQAVTQLLARQA